MENALLLHDSGYARELLKEYRAVPEDGFMDYEEMVKLLVLNGEIGLLKSFLEESAQRAENSSETLNPYIAFDLLVDSRIYEFIQQGNVTPGAVLDLKKHLDKEYQMNINAGRISELMELRFHYANPGHIGELIENKQGSSLLFALASYFHREKQYTVFQAVYAGRIFSEFLLNKKNRRSFIFYENEIRTFTEANHYTDSRNPAYLDAFALLKGIYDFQDYMNDDSAGAWKYDQELMRERCVKLLNRTRNDIDYIAPGYRLFKTL